MKNNTLIDIFRMLDEFLIKNDIMFRLKNPYYPFKIVKNTTYEEEDINETIS